MKIRANILFDFVRKASVNGAIEGSCYNSTDAGLKVITKDCTNQVIADGLLRKEAFVVYDNTKLLIRNNKRFMDYLSQFGNIEVTVENVDNDLVISGKINNRTVTANMKSVSEDMLDGNLKGIPSSLLFDMKSIKVNCDILGSAKKHTDMLKTKSMTLTGANNKLSVTVGEDQFDLITQEQDLVTDDFKVKLPEIFLQVIDVVSGDIDMFVKSDYPIKLVERTKDYEFSVIVAPISE